ncbi:MAG: hypothetical protein IKT59_05540 [Bacteroidales bacterium]|nr:hypothetical protein [Bacteroidales bacterium]
MKHLYHFCLSAGNEVMYRSEADFIRAFNCYAVALYRTDSSSLADSFMSNHFHACVETDKIKELIYHYRTAYSRYFNRKYHRSGSLGERVPFVIDVVGVYHRLAALSYTKRNALHHGVAATPFAYPYNSANAIFRMELGKSLEPDILPRHKFYRFLPDKADVPAHYKMNRKGLLLRESVMDIQQVEYFYNTPRNYMFYMNRISGEEWEQEQEKEGGRVLNLSQIESGVKMNDLSSMLKNEYGRRNYTSLSDISLCEMIDSEILPLYGVQSVYQLDKDSKNRIANDLYINYHVHGDRIRRCLVL